MENMEQEKLFTQAEVDEIISKRLARGKGKQAEPEEKPGEEEQPVERGTEEKVEAPEEKPEVPSEENKPEEEKPEKQAEPEATKDQPATENNVGKDLLVKYARAELKGAMAMQGIDPQKLDRAVRLIGPEEFMDEAGNINNDRMVELITELIGNWPELRRQDQNSKFKFGIGQSDNAVTNNLIAKAFGND